MVPSDGCDLHIFSSLQPSKKAKKSKKADDDDEDFDDEDY